MPKIPIYQSEQRLVSESPRARVSPSAFGQEGRNIAAVGEAISKTHDIIRNAYDFQQTGEAKLKTLEGHNALLAKAQEDGDNTGDFSQYDSEMARIKEDALSSISNPAARGKFVLEHDLSAAQIKSQISGIFRKNMVSKGLANLDVLNQNYISEYAKSGDPALLEMKDSQINDYVRQGFITADDAQKLKTKTSEQAHWNKYLSDYQINPTETVKNTDKYGLTIEQTDKARRLEKEAEKIVNENRAINLGKATEAALNYLITDNDVDALVAADKLNPGTGIKEKDAPTLRKSISRGLYYQLGGLIDTNETAAEYVGSAKKLFALDPKNKTEAFKTILQMYSDGYADAEELKFLNQLVASEKTIDKITRQKLHFWSSEKTRLAYGDKGKLKQIAAETHGLIEQMKNGVGFDDAAQAISKEQVAVFFPDYKTYPKDGKVKSNGTNIIRVFPDGSIRNE